MTTGKKSLYLLISLIVIVSGYFFLFFGNVIGKNNNRLFTEIGLENNLNEHYMTIESWIYDPVSKKMEVVFDIENKSYDGKDNYLCSAISRKYNNISAEVIVNTRDILVIHLSNVPKNFGEISLRIYYDEQTEIEPLKVYTNEDVVEIADNISVKTTNQYYIERNERLISKYSIENENYIAEIDMLNTKIENATISISDLQNQFGYKTDAELKEIESKIISIQSEIATYEKDVNMYNLMIEENTNRITNCTMENELLRSEQ